MEEFGLISVEIDGQVKQVQAYKRRNGFDPMTGAPMEEIVIRDGFDPMTGEAAYVAVEKNGFDPMTGAPLFAPANAGAPEPQQQSPVSQVVQSVKGDVVNVRKAGSGNGRKTAAPKKGVKIPTGAIIGIAAAAVVVVLAVVFVGMFSSKQAKILKAVNKTIENDTFGSVLVESSKILSSDSVTVDVAGEISAYGQGGEINATVAADVDNAKVYAGGSFDIAGASAEANFYYDDSKLQFSIPTVSKSVYEYNYTKSNKGELADLIEDNTDGSIEDINVLLGGAAKAMKQSSSYKKKSTAAVLKATKDIKIKKIDAQKFEVDGKDRKCDGYGMTITDKDIKNIMTALKDVRTDVYGDILDEMMEAMENLTNERMPDMDDLDDEIEDSIDFDEDIELNFYIYKGMLAAVSVNVDDEEILVEFQGGDNRTSNMVVSFDGTKILKRESEISGKAEEGSLKIMGANEKIKYSYDKSTGDLVVDFGYKIKANYLVKGDTISLTIDENIDGVSVDGSLTISKGSRISALKGDIFDIGNADEDDIMSEVEDIAYELGDMMYGLDLY